ncbi:MAG: glycoside hydrolase [Dokdonella sp.]|nr:glycoside hydrolase [Dokdonella sp.]
MSHAGRTPPFATPIYRNPAMLRLLALLLLVLPPLLAAHEGEHPSAAPATALGASAAFDGDGRLWLADVVDGRVRLRQSGDLGRHFGPATRVNAEAEDIDHAGENRPKLTFGPAGEIYVSWSQRRPKKWSSFVRFARSLDGGRHFSAPITVHRDRGEATHSFDALAVDGAGRPLIAWIDARDHLAAMQAGQAYAGLAIYYAWSDDRGASFQAERRLADHSCECCRLALVRDPSGAVRALFRAVSGSDVRDHAYALLPTDGSAAQASRATFSGWQVAACPEQGPGLAFGAGGVAHAVWYEASEGPAIWYGQLDPGHAPRHMLKLGTAGARHADVASSGRRVWVAWNQLSADGYTLMLRSSGDGGISFGAPRTLARASVAASTPQLLVHEGQAYVAWNTAAGFQLLPAERAP